MVGDIARESKTCACDVRSELEAQYSDTLEQAIGIYQPTLFMSMFPIDDVLCTSVSQLSCIYRRAHVNQPVIIALDRDGDLSSWAKLVVPTDFAFNFDFAGEVGKRPLFVYVIRVMKELNVSTTPFACACRLLNGRRRLR